MHPAMRSQRRFKKGATRTGGPAGDPNPRDLTLPQNNNTDTADGAVPRLPHERDESADRAPDVADPAVAQGARDVERGLVDTDRADPMNEIYRRLKGKDKTSP
ncbi:MAG: hypothetical protein H7125_06345 [Proteobacteria bacterium]|nr:hypothetical protein [Burkholderiales bacterium]